VQQAPGVLCLINTDKHTLLTCTATCRSTSLEVHHAFNNHINSARLEARISKDLHETLKRSAALQNRTLTDFVVAAVQEAAESVIRQGEVIKLSLADQKAFAEAILSPSRATPALEQAFEVHRKLVATE
jgi:uncharacterized protein (DUF1778 family)